MVQKLKDTIRSSDTLVVREFDKLGRNKRLTLKRIQYFKENNVRLLALNLPNTQLNTNDNLMLETINNIIIERWSKMKFKKEIKDKKKEVN